MSTRALCVGFLVVAGCPGASHAADDVRYLESWVANRMAWLDLGLRD